MHIYLATFKPSRATCVIFHMVSCQQQNLHNNIMSTLANRRRRRRNGNDDEYNYDVLSIHRYGFDAKVASLQCILKFLNFQNANRFFSYGDFVHKKSTLSNDANEKKHFPYHSFILKSNTNFFFAHKYIEEKKINETMQEKTRKKSTEKCQLNSLVVTKND